MTAAHHISQYQAIIGELKEEVQRLRGKISSGNLSDSQETEESKQKLRVLKNELIELFREQMSLR